MIRIIDVSLSLGDHLIFQLLNFKIESGAGYLIAGKNGSGKTTLLQLLAGKLQPRAGTVSYDFIDPSLTWDEKFALRNRNIHYIPVHALRELVNTHDLFYQQRYYSVEDSPWPTTVRSYLGERIQNLDQLKLPSSLQIDHLFHLDLTQLSNGQVKKIIIIKQLLDSIPKILLLDYPFEGLDLQSRIELRNFLDHLSYVHSIQLIVADHEHPQLPTSITKRLSIEKWGITNTNFAHTTHSPTESLIKYVEKVKNQPAPVVEFRNISIQYSDKVIVNKLNWKIGKGERWALTGPNGSGKTTLFSMIFADHPMAYSEAVFLFGQRRGSGESIWDIKKRISYLGPEQAHFLDYSMEQLKVIAYLEKVTSSKQKIDQLITYFQIESLLLRQLKQLSSGQLQLVLLLALFLDPRELLLLDEPFQFLDPQQKKAVTDYLHSFLDESITLILITHYEEDVTRWTHKRLKL
jgi:molybdate transport system ATP-binding protein